jgi:YD repeat-containing protein
MRRSPMSGILLVLCCALVVASMPMRQAHAADETFAARKARVLEVAAGEKEYNLFTIAAKFRTGRDVAQACRMLDSMAHDRAMGGMFYSYTMIGLYLFTRDVLPESLAVKIREAYRVRTMYRGDTENHWVMYYTGLYLAAQTWPGERGTAWFNGKSSTENFAEARGWLEHWMQTTTTIGQGEFDSPTYMAVFLNPMLVLHEFAADSVMRQRAGMMLDLLFADFAVEHLEGSFGGAHSRDYPEDIINPLGAPSTMWAWLYFGRPRFEQWDDARYRPRNRGSWETVFAALSSYELPPIVARMAVQRDTPYVHREKKRTRNIIRGSDVMNRPVYKYTYMTKDYVLGSLQGGILQPIQQHTWDVTFAEPEPNNTIFTLHPFASGNELAMFFPEDPQFLAGEVDRYHKVYTNPDKWNSSSPYEQTFQHNNSIIVLYAIPPGTMHQHMDGFFPLNLDERILDPSGWIFCRKGPVYVGVYPLADTAWIRESVNWRLRSSASRTGVIVEVASQSDVRSFASFMKELRSRPLNVAGYASSQTVSYTARDGKVMRFTYDGARMLDGVSVTLETDKLYDGPWMQSVAGSGVIRLTDGVRTRVLDFPHARVTEQ